ncbi:MAG: hypothetical protein WBP94_20860 [Rhodomicrobiaceae bacterium]
MIAKSDFVDQQERRTGRERGGDRQKLFLGGAQAPGFLAHGITKPDEFHDVTGFFMERRTAFAREEGTRANRAAKHDIFERRQIRCQGYYRKGAHDAAPLPLLLREAREVLAVEDNPARSQSDSTSNKVDESRRVRKFAADDTNNFAATHVERRAIKECSPSRLRGNRLCNSLNVEQWELGRLARPLSAPRELHIPFPPGSEV